MKTCISITDITGQYPIEVSQSEAKGKRFTVTYGRQVKRGLTYKEACMEFGAVVFHALACDGRLDNSGD